MRTIVVKYGGSVRDEPTYLLKDIAYYAKAGHRIVVVHGGGPEITHYLERLGLTSKFVQGQRVTDEAVLDVAEMVLAGRVGKRLVRALQAYGVRAVGISGEDAKLLDVVPFAEDESLGFVGRVVHTDVALLDALLSVDMIPVVAPLGVDQLGHVRNINADYVAGAIAAALQADAFVLATDVAGVRESAQSLHAVPTLNSEQAVTWIANGVVSGGMVPKVMAAVEAVRGGSASAYIVDGRQAGILEAVIRGDTIGTRIVDTGERGVQDAG